MPNPTREEMVGIASRCEHLEYGYVCPLLGHLQSPCDDDQDITFSDIRTLIHAPEVKRVSVKMESIRWIFDRAVGEMGNGIGAGVIAAWLSEIGVEVTGGEVVDGGKREVERG
jgi:hypothetical protein